MAAAQEERFSRVKHDDRFPAAAARYCLEAAGIEASELDAVVFYEKPFLRLERLLETYLHVAPRGLGQFIAAMPHWLRDKLWIKEKLRSQLHYTGPILFPEHHQSHAAAAFFPSPFERAAFLTLDGVGEWATASYGRGEGNRIQILGEQRFPHSLGLLYSAFTYYTGFRVNSGEYKVMGLAPYGEPRFRETILRHLVDLREDGSFRLNMDYFGFQSGMTMTNGRFHKLFDGPPRRPESPLRQRDLDLARSIQEVTEEIVLRMGRHVRRQTGLDALCLSGGVALNCVANGRLLREGPFRRIWIQPAAGDAGAALGAALYAFYQYHDQPRAVDGETDGMAGAYLGPDFDEASIRHALDEYGARYTRYEEDGFLRRVAGLLAQGKVVGWFQGRMEFGPRALGNRSILADPRSPTMQRRVNMKIKFREGFRPFAPAVPLARAGDYFDLPVPSPYMLLTAPLRPEQQCPLSPEDEALTGLDKLKVVRSSIPAVTHVDNSARVQTVSSADNPLFHRLLEAFYEKSGCPVLVNTSFNVRGEPIVNSPKEAYRCFMATDLDFLAIGPFLLDKELQPDQMAREKWTIERVLD